MEKQSGLQAFTNTYLNLTAPVHSIPSTVNQIPTASTQPGNDMGNLELPVSDTPIADTISIQQQTIERLTNTNTSLVKFNEFSQQRFNENAMTMERYTAMIVKLKVDLDVVFKRIRAMKLKLQKLKPKEFAMAQSEVGETVEDE